MRPLSYSFTHVALLPESERQSGAFAWSVWGPYLIFLCLILAIQLFIQHAHWWSMLVAVTYFTGTLVAEFFTAPEFELQTFTKLGKLVLNEEGLGTDEAFYAWKDMENLHIELGDYTRAILERHYRSKRPAVWSLGHRNSLKFQHGGQTYRFQIIIPSTQYFSRLRPLLLHFYRSGIYFTEHFEGRRSYGLANSLTYAEIQKFKQQFAS